MVLARHKLTSGGAIILGLGVAIFFSFFYVPEYLTKTAVSYEVSLLDENGQPDDYFTETGEVYQKQGQELNFRGSVYGHVNYTIENGTVNLEIYEESDDANSIANRTFNLGEEEIIPYSFMSRDYQITITVWERKIITNEIFWLMSAGGVVVLLGIMGLFVEKSEKKQKHQSQEFQFS